MITPEDPPHKSKPPHAPSSVKRRHGGQMATASEQERREAGKDDVADVSLDTPERFHHGLASSWPFLVERYVEDKVEGHVHFRYRDLGGRVKRPPRDYCAVFKRAKPDGVEVRRRPAGASTQ